MCDCLTLPNVAEVKPTPVENGASVKHVSVPAKKVMHERVFVPVSDSYYPDNVAFKDKMSNRRNRTHGANAKMIRPEVNGYIRISHSSYLRDDQT